MRPLHECRYGYKLDYGIAQKLNPAYKASCARMELELKGYHGSEGCAVCSEECAEGVDELQEVHGEACMWGVETWKKNVRYDKAVDVARR